MALYVNTNASSLNAQRMMANSTNALDTSYKRLGLNQGNRNAQDGISYAQTAEGAMDEMTNMYQRIRTLALQSANGTNSSADRTALQQEVESLCSEIERISADTTWGGQKILDGSTASVDFQVGADAGQKITLSFAATAKKASDGSAAALAGNWGVDALIGAIGVKETDADKKGFKSITASIDGADKSIKVFDISNADKAQDVLASIDNYIAAVDAKRADFGALQNRLESTIRNQSNVSENVSAARSRIRDTDFASETAAMTQQNIIQQASQSILSQANQRPQVALSLLG